MIDAWDLVYVHALELVIVGIHVDGLHGFIELVFGGEGLDDGWWLFDAIHFNKFGGTWFNLFLWWYLLYDSELSFAIIDGIEGLLYFLYLCGHIQMVYKDVWLK